MQDLTEIVTEMDRASAWGVMGYVLAPKVPLAEQIVLVYGPVSERRWLIMEVDALQRCRALILASILAFETFMERKCPILPAEAMKS